MNPTIVSGLRIAVLVALLALLVLALTAPAAPVASTSFGASAVVPAFSMTEAIGDRTRMIQFSIVAVVVGIAVLWWGNKSS